MILLSDEEFIKLKFRTEFGYELDLNNPKSFKWKIQWLKLYNHEPIYTIMVDKYKVKENILLISLEENIWFLYWVYGLSLKRYHSESHLNDLYWNVITIQEQECIYVETNHKLIKTCFRRIKARPSWRLLINQEESTIQKMYQNRNLWTVFDRWWSYIRYH